MHSQEELEVILCNSTANFKKIQKAAGKAAGELLVGWREILTYVDVKEKKIKLKNL